MMVWNHSDKLEAAILKDYLVDARKRVTPESKITPYQRTRNLYAAGKSAFDIVEILCEDYPELDEQFIESTCIEAIEDFKEDRSIPLENKSN